MVQVAKAFLDDQRGMTSTEFAVVLVLIALTLYAGAIAVNAPVQHLLDILREVAN